MGAHQYVPKDQPVQPEDDTRTAEVRGRLADVLDRAEQFPLWLTTEEARRFLRRPTVKATYEWLRRHRIVRRNDGTISRLDLQRAGKQPRKKRVMAAASLLNLRKRHA